ncbi:hypothetical protein V8C42DRAFT_352787 [Trichoderma barbatum]
MRWWDRNEVIEPVCNKLAREFQKKMSPSATFKLPGYGYPLDRMPRGRFPVIATNRGIEWTAGPLFIRELCMLKVVEEVTNKPGWWDNVRDTNIAYKWKKEILGLEWSNYLKHADFTPSMADWCIEELKLKADLYEKSGLVPVLDSSACVIKSDRLVPDALKQELSAGSLKLAEVISNNDVSRDGLTFHLINPSICPLIYNRSRILPDRHINLTNCLEACGQGDILLGPRDSEGKIRTIGGLENEVFDTSFQWLPCDIVVDEAGNAKTDSYINNLHPTEHADMYTTIEKFITLALPAWDIIYRWPENFWHQRINNQSTRYDCKIPDVCGESECSRLNRPATEALAAAYISMARDPTPSKCAGNRDDRLLNLKLERNESWMEIVLQELTDEAAEWCRGMFEGREDRYKWFDDTHPLQLPEPENTSWFKYIGLDSSNVRSSDFFSQKNNRLQVIVQLTEIHLTPESPEYPGDLWEIDGMLNEHIVSTALFCYDSDNITDGHLYFDAAPNEEGLVCVPNIFSNDTFRAFALPPGGEDFQVIGRVLIDPAKAVFYPNIYRHRQGSFSLADRSRSGYRKVLKLCLVDPAIPIISTSNVPPQQYHWWTKCEIHNEGVQIAQRLPPEVQRMVHNYVDFPIDHNEAKRIRQTIKSKRMMTESDDGSQHDEISDSDESQNDESSDSG